MKIIKQLVVLLLFGSAIAGCASGARTENMIYHGAQKAYNKQLKNNMEVDAVGGGKKTNPAWASQISNEDFRNALEKTLSNQGLLSDNGKYKLEALIIGVDQPWFGLDLVVNTSVQYMLTNKQNGTVVMEKTIVQDAKATIGDSLYAVERLRLANENSARSNIEKFLEALSELKIKSQEISLE